MSIETILSQVPHPQGYTFPDYSLPRGDPVMPIALTQEELSELLELYDRFADVDPTGMESNPFLEAANTFLKQSFGATFTRPDEQLHEDVGDLLTDFSNDLGGKSIGVVDATPKHHRTLYFFLVGCKNYHTAPHVRFQPGEGTIETLYRVYERVVEQDVYLKDPASVLE